jgi:hypothetical protein
MKTCLFNLALLIFLTGCAVGHDDFISIENRNVGTKMVYDSPYKWDNSGELIRADYLVSGKGLTDITKNDKGDIVYHYSVHEILANERIEPSWVGKCLIYYVVDPDTFLIQEWGFDEGGNPLSCRTFV